MTDMTDEDDNANDFPFLSGLSFRATISVKGDSGVHGSFVIDTPFLLCYVL